MSNANYCNCTTLGRTISGNELLTTHGRECPAREAELMGLLIELTSGIEEWASQEDGVYESVWPHYCKAKMLIGQPVRESPILPKVVKGWK